MLSVCPARAGMIRRRVRGGQERDRLPRARGDDPVETLIALINAGFAPHARG